MIQTKTLTSSAGKRERHLIIKVDDPTLPFSVQLARVKEEYELFINDHDCTMTPVFRRWFLSDSANQAHLLPDWDDCATSVVEQAPLDFTKVALWVWFIEDAVVRRLSHGVYAMEHNGHTHIFEAARCRPGLDPESATDDILSSTAATLADYDGSLLSSCVRTWFFVQNVDVNYAGVVKGRNSVFNRMGLTPSTRFIASTGIGGRHADSSVTVQMDSYSVLGLHEGQMRQINAPEYLNPTYEYGVAFERATSVDYIDRRQLFVSGTASIDNHGEVVWEGDIRRQTERMWTNVEALLREASCRWENVGHMLVYLRDPADAPVVGDLFRQRFPDTPFLILLAPVCRPGWLIEMECMATAPLPSLLKPSLQ